MKFPCHHPIIYKKQKLLKEIQELLFVKIFLYSWLLLNFVNIIRVPNNNEILPKISEFITVITPLFQVFLKNKLMMTENLSFLHLINQLVEWVAKLLKVKAPFY